MEMHKWASPSASCEPSASTVSQGIGDAHQWLRKTKKDIV